MVYSQRANPGDVLPTFVNQLNYFYQWYSPIPYQIMNKAKVSSRNLMCTTYALDLMNIDL